ncbi:hypothetical protein DO021_20600 [Desulfobacter hydrogenophilus]|uniref:Sulfotransferase domain-containing protein n=1 Tax=Desulfobacter hydrogenophilus TaxID=2291 RepID=A0A328FAQ8_9BACT|nr:hypothetical protein [Desulfobacter hydrogenophilus]NDY74289.1 hypothetical protein [Desulfobacter hydrogenophilus]QBH15070.1 hypothetical protein EYB58_20380 [Desulfobacter hydrogenophilus]RAM00163.1 hypothetical protein DO021_20600 [Desulfobacter hydrogenophilus]
MFNLKSIHWQLKTIVSSNFLFFKYLIKPLSKHKELFLNKGTNLIIEGYPRCGNTFCVAAFYYFSENNLSIARHRHEIGHVKHALFTGVPILIVFREPIEAISSFIVREGVSERFAVNFYIKFNSFILKNRDNLLLFDFNDIVNNIKGVVNCFSKKCGLTLIGFDNKGDVDEIKNIVIEMEKKDSGSDNVRSTHVAYPNKSRDILKNKVKYRLINQHSTLLEKANNIYSELMLKRTELVD